MAQTINTNVASLTAQRNLSSSNTLLATSMARLSSGMRVNSAKDDAAGIAIAERMQTAVRGMNVAMRNANDAISMSQSTEAAIGKVTDMLQRMRELAIQAANATNTLSDRDNLDEEYGQLADQVLDTLTTFRFNGLNVLGSDGGQTFTYQIGDRSGDTVDITPVRLDNTTAITNVAGTSISISGTNGLSAQGVLTDIDSALDLLNTERAKLGAVQNRMDTIISVLQTNAENTAAARGRIMDADFAVETANLARAQILQQAGTAMVAQANALPQAVLQLLKS
ncbi:MAG: flagellin [Rubrivivax sp.]